MSDKIPTLEKIRQVNSSFPFTDSVKKWKAQGKHVVGYTCPYVPAEVIYAAGVLPIRITGDSTQPQIDDATAYLHDTICTFARTCLALGLNKKYDYLDGLVIPSTCDHMRRLFDAWTHYVSPPFAFTHLINFPHNLSDLAHQRYRMEFKNLLNRLEYFFGTEVSEAALRHSISVYDNSRKMLQKLYEMRKSATPPITGAETLEVLNASARMVPEEFGKVLGSLLEELVTSHRSVKSGVRLMIIGSPLNNAEFVKSIEDAGGTVVVDGLCTGIQMVADSVNNDPKTNPLAALAQRYLGQYACAAMEPSSLQVGRMMDVIKEYRVDAVVSQIVHSCLPCLWHQPIVKDKIESRGIPLLELHLEYGEPGSGQMKTRVQAFLETLAADV